MEWTIVTLSRWTELEEKFNEVSRWKEWEKKGQQTTKTKKAAEWSHQKRVGVLFCELRLKFQFNRRFNSFNEKFTYN